MYSGTRTTMSIPEGFYHARFCTFSDQTIDVYVRVADGSMSIKIFEEETNLDRGTYSKYVRSMHNKESHEDILTHLEVWPTCDCCKNRSFREIFLPSTDEHMMSKKDKIRNRRFEVV